MSWKTEVANIAKEYGFVEEQIYTNPRELFKAHCAIAGYLTDERKWSLKKIGNLLHRDHSTVVNMLKRYRDPTYVRKNKISVKVSLAAIAPIKE